MKKKYIDNLSGNNSTYHIKLFIAGNEPNSSLAKSIVEDVCETYLKNNSVLELIDVYKNYQEALDNKIMAVPTLIVQSSQLNIKIVGSLNTTENLVKAIGLSPKKLEQ